MKNYTIITLLAALATITGCEPGDQTSMNEEFEGMHDEDVTELTGEPGAEGPSGIADPPGEPGVDYPGPAIGIDGMDLTGEEGQTGTSVEVSTERDTFALSDEELETLLSHFNQKVEEETSQPASPEVWASEVQCQSNKDCDDGQGCTTDTCDKGFCAHTTVEGCKPCETHADCPADKLCQGISVGMLLYKCDTDFTCQPSAGVGQFCNHLCTSEPEVACIDECEVDADCGVSENPCMKNYCLQLGDAGNSCRYNEPIEGCIPEE